MIPPFCPYKACEFHYHPPSERWWKRIGFHHADCFGEVQRYRCFNCNRTFSDQTFSTDYYAKRLVDYERLEQYLSSSMSVRALSRAFSCSCGTILNRADRLARQEIALHATLRPKADRHDSVCIDGFVSFDRSQYFPNNITISIASGSRYALAFTHATLRRSGTMREDQKEHRTNLYKGVAFEHRALERSFSELLDELERDRPPEPDHPLLVITDEKQEYARAFYRHRLFREQDGAHRVVHLTVNSKFPRTIWNPLFPSNYVDREIRKDQAAHHRESTCFGRNVANGLSRMACYLGWHNYRKKFLIKAPIADKRTHAAASGIDPTLVEGERTRMFKRRTFLSLAGLEDLDRKLWLKAFPTPGFSKPSYLPDFAFGVRG